MAFLFGILRFDITILGCGAATPNLQRGATAQVLCANEKLYLIDCGEGTQLKLRKYGVKFQKIETVFISHLHGDHYLGLIGLIYSMSLMGREKSLTIVCPKGLDEIIHTQIRHSKSYLSFQIEYIFTDDKSKLVFEDKNITVSTIPLKHRIITNGFVFKQIEKKPNIIKQKVQDLNISLEWIQRIKKGEDYLHENGTLYPNKDLVIPAQSAKSYAYCSDTAYYESIVPIIKKATLLYHEATFLDVLKDRAIKTQHSTALNAATIAKKANVKQLMLGHFSARYTELNFFLEEAIPVFENTILAEEGKTFEI